MKPDIADRRDIKFIISKFYDKLLADEEMLPFFLEFLNNNQLDIHIEIITDFWSDILLFTQSYSNNVMQKHIDKHLYTRFEKEHFDIWTSYFTETIQENFQGEKAERMKSRALSIAIMMQVKMNLYK